MAYTNAWDETTPLGSEQASVLDNYQRQHRLDLGERLEDMFYGFNAASNAAPENDYGVKSLRLYKQTSDPTTATDYGHFYIKLVSGVPELFYQDDTNTAKQLTSGGQINILAADIPNDTLDSQHYAAGSIDNEHLAADIINGAKIADDVVDSEHLVAGGIDAEHIGGIFGASTNVDSDATAFVKAHAYSAPTDGIVTAWETSATAANSTINGYVGATTDPAGAGTLEAHVTSYNQEDRAFLTFVVPKGKYWEITAAQSAAHTIRWRAIGTLSAPVDQD